jgi:hypothetical protein
MTDINAVLQRAYNTAAHHKDHLTVNIAVLFGPGLPDYTREPPCFFLIHELSYSKATAKAAGIYRHCKLYKGHYLDYTTRTEYASLEQWAAACGSTIDNIMFGWNRFDGRPTHTTLKKLMQYLCPPPDPEVDALTKFVTKLHVDELSLRNVLVDTRTGIIKTYDKYMEESLDE